MRISRLHYGKRRLERDRFTLPDIIAFKEACEKDKSAREQAKKEYFESIVRPIAEKMFYELPLKRIK